MILIFILYAVFSAMTFINSALMVSNPYPFIVGMLRALGSSFLLLIYARIFNRKALQRLSSLSKNDWKDLLTYGILIHAFVMCGFSFAVLYADPVSICFIVASGPFLTAFIEYFQGVDRLNRQKFLGLLIGCCGLVPILSSSGHEQIDFSHGLAWVGNTIAFLSMVLFCYGWIVLKKLLKRSVYPLEIVNGVAMLVGGLVSAFFVVCIHGFGFISLPFSHDFPVLMVAFLASSLMTYSLYAYLLTKYSATFISFAGFLEPALGMFYGALLWGYPIRLSACFSLVVLFLGLFVFYQAELVSVISSKKNQK